MTRHEVMPEVLLLVGLLVGACGPAASAPAVSPAPGTQDSPGSAAAGSPIAVTFVDSAAPLAPLRAGALNIVTLGDSLTEGEGDNSDLGGYPGRLQALLTPLRPDSKVTNLGRAGWSSSDLINGQNGLPSQLTQAIDDAPDAALVWIGSNDLWNLYEYGPEPMTSDIEQADLQSYSSNIDKILHELTGHGAAVFIALLDDQSKRPVVANPNPGEPAFPGTTTADLALMSGHLRAYNDIIRAAAARYGATTVDFFDTTIFTDAATLADDGNHPNSAGYDRVAQIWFAALQGRMR